jgi:hypothetical protein
MIVAMPTDTIFFIYYFNLLCGCIPAKRKRAQVELDTL